MEDMELKTLVTDSWLSLNFHKENKNKLFNKPSNLNCLNKNKIHTLIFLVISVSLALSKLSLEYTSNLNC